MYGVKGRIDVTVNTTLEHYSRTHGTKIKMTPMPLELKSGKIASSPAYRAQVIIYCLMLSDRYNQEVKGGMRMCYPCSIQGLLWGLGDNQTVLVEIDRNLLQSIIANRNTLAISLRQNRLPVIMNNKHVCKGCFYLDQCAFVHKVNQIEQCSAQQLTLVQDFGGWQPFIVWS